MAERAQEEARSYERNLLLDAMRSQDIAITDERRHQEAISKAHEMEAQRGTAEIATLGRTFIRDANEANAFSKLSRYEAAIERSLYKALHKLQRLQAARRAEGNVPPPVAIDVDVSGLSREEP